MIACLRRNEVIMKKKTKGNQKHLTLSQRLEIEKALLAGESFTAIARKLDKDPSSISKEVRRHSRIKERKNLNFAPIPCANRKGCKTKYLCDDLCNTRCSICKNPDFKCIDICPNYFPKVCDKLVKPPYVCNGCGKRVNCLMEMKVYSAKYADDTYRERLVSSREGINQTPASLMKMDELVSPLIKKGQSIAHIYAHHAEEIGCSRRTLYNYLDQSVLTARNIDLRRRVKYKQRRTATRTSVKDRIYRQNRNYPDFQNYCDPYSSWQKGMLEKNHEYIRLVLSKGTSLSDLDHQDVMLLQNNINSEARDSLNGCSPFKLSQLLLDKNLHQALNLKEIAPDDVFLKPELLKK